MTEGQLAELYKSETIAKAMVETKGGSRKTWRPHPEAPTLPEAKQYLVNVCSSKQKLITQLHQQGIKVKGEMEAEGASAMIADLRKEPSTKETANTTDDEPSVPGPDSHSSGDYGTSSDSDSSSDSARHKKSKKEKKESKQEKKEGRKAKKNKKKEEKRRKKEAARAAKKERKHKSDKVP